MEVISKSGTNQFHGDLFDSIRNNFFDARTPFNPHTLRIVTDKLFFFAANEGLRQRQVQTLIGLVPSDSERRANCGSRFA